MKKIFAAYRVILTGWLHSLKKRLVVVWFAGLFGVGSLLIGGTVWNQNGPVEDATPRVLPVEVKKVEAVDQVRSIRFFSGTVEARRSSQLGFERLGKITSILVEEGQTVKKGTPLALLDTRDLEIRLRQIRAQQAEAQAHLDELVAGPRREAIRAAKARVAELQSRKKLAEIRLLRREELLERQAISKEEYDLASFEVNTLQASADAAQHELDELLAGTRREKITSQQAVVDQLSAQVDSLQLEIEKSTLKAPFAGRISKKLVDEGRVVSIAHPVISMVEHSTPRVKIGLPVDYALKLVPGTEFPIQIGKTEYRAQLLSILPELEGRTRSATALFQISDDSAAFLKTGQVARLELNQTTAVSGFWLPTSALTRGIRGLWSCTVLEPLTEGQTQARYRAQRVDVEILITEEDRVLVRGPLRADDLVIHSGTNRIVPGQYVRPVQL